VTDNTSNNLGISYYVDGVQVSSVSLNTASSTTYTISYTATDQAGNTATSTRTVNVNDPNIVVTEETTEETATSTEESAATSTPQT